MYRAVPFLLALALLAVTGGAISALLPACSINLPFGINAPDACAGASAGDLIQRDEALEAENAAIVRKIALLERDLARVQCTPARVPTPAIEQPEPVPEPVQQAEPEPLPPPYRADEPNTESGINREAFQSRDLAAMEGCWELDSDYETRNVRTGRITRYPRWSICFDDQGAGYQQMFGDDGRICQDHVTGAFSEEGKFTVTEPANLDCSDGSFIYRRDTYCELKQDGRAECRSLQPERGTDAFAALRRAGVAP